MIIIYIFLLIISVFSAMSFFSLRKLKNQNNSLENFTDDRYYELKYKLQFISSVGVIIIGVCGFLGYDSMNKFVSKYEDKTDSLNIKIKDYDSRISRINSELEINDTKIIAYSNFIKRINKSKNQFSSSLLASNKQLNSLTDTINIIKKRNILDKSFYVIDNLFYAEKLDEKENMPKKYYFKDLSTILGDRLPIFDKKPIIFIIPQSGAEIIIKNVTTEYVEVGLGTVTTWDNEVEKPYTFGILIAKRQI